MDTLAMTRSILSTSLQLGARAEALKLDTPLMGHFPELNSLTVMGIISGIEEQTGLTIADQEISAEIFQTVGTLTQFIEQKTAGPNLSP